MNSAEVEVWLCREIARRLEVSPLEVHPDRKFASYGLDSAMAVDLAMSLSNHCGTQLKTTALWEFPTISRLARHAAGEVERPQHDSRHAIAGDEPIAVVGLACRLPRAASIEALWELLRRGDDAVTEVPRDRWPLEPFYDPRPRAPGKSVSKWGGFLDSVDLFDPVLFGISPREATYMDPQQRLVLELAWEALEDAGVPPLELAGTRGGVFIGCMWSDYATLWASDQDTIAAHTATGSDTSIVAARVSYFLGLEGPSLTVNTACSSSLIAVHLACQSLRSGDSELVLAGGVNLMLAPQSTVAMSKFGGLSPDGRCYTFDARANGYVRGEGAAMVVLKTLSRALRDGDRIESLILSSAANNDGASNGLTAPNPKAQEAVLREAYRRARLAPDAISYVEAHGTGTLLGDPIEVRALGAVLGGARRQEPLRVGSLKSNLGHLEAAAGVAGLVKTVLCTSRRQLPPSLHFERPNPHIPFEELNVKVQRELEPWPNHEAATAGVSSFGFGGTNCHAVVQEFTRGAARLFPISAPSTDTLRAKAAEQRELLRSNEWSLLGACRQAVRTLSATDSCRGVVLARNREDLDRRLADLSALQPGGEVWFGDTSGEATDVTFVFAGQGCQWPAMGRGLMASSSAFRQGLFAADAILRPLVGWSASKLLLDGDGDWLERSEVAWPLLVAFEVALAVQWQAWGCQPSAVVGHSIGEIAAAHLAGVLSLEAALKLAVAQGEIIAQTHGQGEMLATALSFREAELLSLQTGGRVHIAVSAAKGSTVIGGEPAAITEVAAELEQRGIYCRRVLGRVAAHGPMLEPLADALRKKLSFLRPKPGNIRFISSVTGGPLAGERLDADYWVQHFLSPVLFESAIRRAAAESAGVFLEVSPHPVLKRDIEATLAELKHAGPVVAALQRSEDDGASVRRALARVYTSGVQLSFASLEEGPKDESTALHVLPISSHSPKALVTLGQRYVDALRGWATQEDAPKLSDVVFTAGARRSHHEHRLAASGASFSALADSLQTQLDRRARSSTNAQSFAGGANHLTFVFSGQGAQWAGMARGLMNERVFRDTIQHCDDLFRQLAPWSLERELLADASESSGETQVVQPVLFAFQLALCELWKSWGVVPASVIGHSVGEVAAACVAGALPLERALEVVWHRGSAMQSAHGAGLMLALECSAETALELLRDEAADIAAVNAPGGVVISIETAIDARVRRRCEVANIPFRVVNERYAFHGRQMSCLAPILMDAVSELRPEALQIPMYSALTGQRIEGEELTAEYWGRNVRQTVRFADAASTALRDGARIFLEIGPHPVLARDLRLCAEAQGLGVKCHASARRGISHPQVIGATLSELYVGGAKIHWQASGGEVAVRLPGYVFDRKRYWREQTKRAAAPDAPPASTHWLGPAQKLTDAPDTKLWDRQLGVEVLPYLSEHRVQGQMVIPGALYVEMFAAAAAALRDGEAWALGHVTFDRMLAFPADEARRVWVTATRAGHGVKLRLMSAGSAEGSSWTTHAEGELTSAEPAGPAPLDLDAMRRHCGEHCSSEAHYQRLAAQQLEYGDSFRGVAELWLGSGAALARIEAPPVLEAGFDAHALHPCVLDACIQVFMHLASHGRGLQEVVVPTGIDSVAVHAALPRELWVSVELDETTPFRGHLTLTQADGQVIAELKGVTARPFDSASDAVRHGSALVRSWQAAAPLTEAKVLPETWLVVGEDGLIARAVRGALESRGRRVVRASSGAAFHRSGRDAFELDLGSAAQLKLLMDQLASDPPNGVVFAAGSMLDDGHWATGADGCARAERLVAAAVLLIQALVRQGFRSPPRFLVVTRDAQSVASSDATEGFLQAPLWGLSLVTALEHPEIACKRIDLDHAMTAEQLAAELLVDDGEDQVALRAGARLVPRLEKRSFSASTPAFQPSADGTYLITGGLGGLGLSLAAHLAEKGAGNIVLVGRREPDESARQAIAGMEEAGARVRAIQLDVTNTERVGGLFQWMRQELPPLKGVIHAAGVLYDATLLEEQPERIHEVMSPKVLGAFNLHTASADIPLDFFVLYSSVASLLGSAGQASYAASNAFLDALAHHRRARGLAGLSINWGPFAEVGMAAVDAKRGRRLASRGMRSISLVQGLASFEIALGAKLAQLGFAELDMRQWLEFYPGVAASRQWGSLLDHAARRAGPTLAELLAQQPESERRPSVMALLTAEYAEIMQFDASDVDPQRTFGDAGLDSLMSLEFRNRLEARLGLKLTATLLFTYPTLVALADHLLELTGYAGGGAVLATTKADEPPGFLREVELMSDDEAEKLLLDLVQGAHAGEAS